MTTKTKINKDFYLENKLPKQAFIINQILVYNDFEPYFEAKDFNSIILTTLYGIEKKWIKEKIKKEIQNCQNEKHLIKLNILNLYV